MASKTVSDFADALHSLRPKSGGTAAPMASKRVTPSPKKMMKGKMPKGKMKSQMQPYMKAG